MILLSADLSLFCPETGGYSRRPQNYFYKQFVRPTEIKGLWRWWNRVLYNGVSYVKNEKMLYPYNQIDEEFGEVLGGVENKSLFTIRVEEKQEEVSPLEVKFDLNVYVDEDRMRDENKVRFAILSLYGRRTRIGIGSIQIKNVNCYSELCYEEVAKKISDLQQSLINADDIGKVVKEIGEVSNLVEFKSSRSSKYPLCYFLDYENFQVSLQNFVSDDNKKLLASTYYNILSKEFECNEEESSSRYLMNKIYPFRIKILRNRIVMYCLSYTR
ncbi:type III-B CRISPR module RAMP protein Cmr1 [Sulfolobus sp. E5-1-F]|uniref:type III-B CRISPR module RAMP protein Cmr1 n=1 Tax=Saccharolobus sp. E5-1-F TaxID=2663019 RepID=UPI001295CF90|nr:type III-B CRISPR module RAMP protein Cmr1 [Sulfolobus sp. E5-1-F]QGA53824.1 type III-B CRISPR module RAMP protein Cmr1 [Sulfolobus sp. E5-1-F]